MRIPTDKECYEALGPIWHWACVGAGVLVGLALAYVLADLLLTTVQ